jgi:hypothetical protein
MLFCSSSNERTGSIYFRGTFFTGSKQAGSLNVGISLFSSIKNIPVPSDQLKEITNQLIDKETFLRYT